VHKNANAALNTRGHLRRCRCGGKQKLTYLQYLLNEYIFYSVFI